MNKWQLLVTFMGKAKDDPRISAAHVSLYCALLHLLVENPLCVFSKDVMPFCKISGAATYHKCIRELDEYGYIKYVPSFNHFLGSLVYII